MKKRRARQRIRDPGMEREGGRGGTENEAERGRAGVMLFDRVGFRMGSW